MINIFDRRNIEITRISLFRFQRRILSFQKLQVTVQDTSDKGRFFARSINYLTYVEIIVDHWRLSYETTQIEKKTGQK